MKNGRNNTNMFKKKNNTNIFIYLDSNQNNLCLVDAVVGGWICKQQTDNILF